MTDAEKIAIAKEYFGWVAGCGGFDDAVIDFLNAIAAAQLAAPAAPEVWCGCGDQIMPDDGARCGTCVAVKFPQGERN